MKTAEIITLLYETTLGPPSLDPKPLLNPTTGVIARSQEEARGLVYRADPSRPGGGVFIATNRGVKEDYYKDLAPGTVVVEGDENDEDGNGNGREGEAKRGRRKRGEGEETESAAAPPPNPNPNPSHPHANANAGSNQRVQVKAGSTGLDVLSAASASMMPSSASASTSPASNSNSHSHSLSSLLGPGASSPSAMLIDTMPSSGSRASQAAQAHSHRSAQHHHQNQQPPHQNQPQHSQHQQSQSQYQSSFGNLNPGMASSSSNGSGSGSSMGGDETVQVMNVLEADVPPNVVEQMQVADTGLLEGLPGQMFDWGES